MHLGIHSSALAGLSLLLASACGGELPPEEAAALSTQSAHLASCSPDVTPPEAICQPEAGTVDCVSYGYLYEDGSLYSVSDNCALNGVSVNPVGYGGPGTYSTGISVVDASHNSAGCASAWKVVDTSPPRLTLKGPAQVTVAYGSGFWDQGVYADDLCDGGPLDFRVTRSGWVDPRTPGVYPISYSLSDLAGHTTHRTRLVTVLPASDCTAQLGAPVLVLEGDSEEKLDCGRDTWSDPGELAADACGTVTVHSYNSGQDAYGPGPNANVEGRYEIQYLAWNGQGTTSALRTVVVEDASPPLLRLKGSIHEVHTCGSAWVDPGYTAWDACYGDVSSSVEVTGFVNGWVAGRYTLSYLARDPGGHPSNLQQRTVDVVNCPW